VTTRNTHPYKRKWSDVTMVEPENNCFPTREFILKELYTAQLELKNKSMKGRTRSPENDRIKVQWYKTWIYCLNSMATVLKEKELDELKESVEEITKTLNTTPAGGEDDIWTPEIYEESY
jgi:hypothetical protein